MLTYLIYSLSTWFEFQTEMPLKANKDDIPDIKNNEDIDELKKKQRSLENMLNSLKNLKNKVWFLFNLRTFSLWTSSYWWTFLLWTLSLLEYSSENSPIEDIPFLIIYSIIKNGLSEVANVEFIKYYDINYSNCIHFTFSNIEMLNIEMSTSS